MSLHARVLARVSEMDSIKGFYMKHLKNEPVVLVKDLTPEEAADFVKKKDKI